MNVEYFVKCWNQIFEVYGWWALALVGITFAIMIPVNMLVKFLFRKATSEPLQRIRKTLSTALVFGVAIGVSYVYVAIVKAKIGWLAVLMNSASVAILSMVVWTVVKLVLQVGIKPLLKALENPIKKQLKQIEGVDTKVLTDIFDKLVEYVKTTNVDNAQAVIEKEQEILNKSVEMLAGFADAVNRRGISEQLYNCLKTKFCKKNKGE